MKREFLMLAHPYRSEPVGGWYWSEKLDGCRAYWDGGITRRQPAAQVPFANTTKDARYVVAPKATGLWSRYGKPIQAPDWWLDKMPPFPLDGELYISRGGFQELMSTVKTIVPGPGWSNVRYMAFDCPPYHAIFANGEIDNINYKKDFRNILGRLGSLPTIRPKSWDFHTVHQWLRDRGERNEVFNVHEQNCLPPGSRDAADFLMEKLSDLLQLGAEGIMIRHPTSLWAAQRCRTLLKVKGMNDAEAEVIGYVWGRETDKGSKLLGLMGALVVRYQCKVFELSGFTEAERVMQKHPDMGLIVCDSTRLIHEAFQEGSVCPGEPVAKQFYNPMFPIGSKVTFKYRELTDAGIPKEARYWRKDERL